MLPQFRRYLLPVLAGAVLFTTVAVVRKATARSPRRIQTFQFKLDSSTPLQALLPTPPAPPAEPKVLDDLANVPEVDLELPDARTVLPKDVEDQLPARRIKATQVDLLEKDENEVRKKYAALSQEEIKEKLREFATEQEQKRRRGVLASAYLTARINFLNQTKSDRFVEILRE